MLTRLPTGRSQLLAALQDLVMLATTSRDAAVLADRTVQHVCDLFAVDSASVTWWDDQRQALRPLASSGPCSSDPRPLECSRGIAGQAFARVEPIVVTDYPAWKFAEQRDVERGIVSSVGVPLRTGERALGTLSMGSLISREFTPEEVHDLSILAAQIAQTLEAARLREESEHHRAEAERLAGLVEQAGVDADRQAEILRGAVADAQEQIRVRQKAEKKLARLHRTLEREHAVLTATLGAMSDGLLLIDAHHRVRYCNAVASDMLRFESEPIVGHPVSNLLGAIAPAIHDPEARARWRASISVVPASFDVATAFPGRPAVTIRVDTFPVQPSSGEPITALLLRDVTSTNLLARAHERERIAMDLHDGAVQSLYGVVMALGGIELDLADKPEAERSLAAARQARAQVSDIISGIRTYASRLRLGISGTRDLRSGLEAIAAEVSMNRLIPPELDLDASDSAQFSPQAVENLLLVAHEATSNVIRHSGATTVAIRCKRVKDACVLTIEDNGRGFVVGATGRRVGDGLRNMRERAVSLGGRLFVKSEPGSGTEVRLEVPLEALSGVAA